MKKILAFFFAVTMFCLSACSVIEKADQALADAGKIERDNQSKSANSIGNYELQATEYALGLDENGQSVIGVKYHFVNNGENAHSFDSGITCHLYQNGVRLSRSYQYAPVNSDVYIKSGAAIDVEYVYELIDTVSDVEIVFELGGSTIYLGEDADDKLTQIIEISKYSDPA